MVDRTNAGKMSKQLIKKCCGWGNPRKTALLHENSSLFWWGWGWSLIFAMPSPPQKKILTMQSEKETLSRLRENLKHEDTVWICTVCM